MLKKIMSLTLVLAMLLTFGAVAEEEKNTPSEPHFVTASGVVKSKTVYQLTAPYSGVLLPYDVETGDTLPQGEVLFTMDTVKIYAPENGTLSAVFVKKGDLCQDTMNEYGMIASIEKENDLMIAATTAGAHNSSENRIIHMGEKVYFCETNDRNNQGEGRVILVNGKDYQVEVTKGDFDLNDEIKLYRDENLGAKSCIGTGRILRNADVPVAGNGRIVSAPVTEGEKVEKGQLLFEIASPDADYGAVSQITMPVNGAVELIPSPAGQQVYKGQLLCKVHDLSQMEIVAEIDEMDMDKIRLGDTLPVELDRYPGIKITGTVVNIGKIGMPKQNAAYYNVTLDVNSNLELLPGMNATVLLPDMKN